MFEPFPSSCLFVVHCIHFHLCICVVLASHSMTFHSSGSFSAIKAEHSACAKSYQIQVWGVHGIYHGWQNTVNTKLNSLVSKGKLWWVWRDEELSTFQRFTNLSLQKQADGRKLNSRKGRLTLTQWSHRPWNAKKGRVLNLKNLTRNLVAMWGRGEL